MDNAEIIEVNKHYWNEHADLWFGTTALPKYGVRAKAGFVIEQLVEESDTDSEEAADKTDIKTRKAEMLPISFCIKARKL